MDFVYVNADVLKSQRELDYWIGLALDYNGRTKKLRSQAVKQSFGGSGNVSGEAHTAVG